MTKNDKMTAYVSNTNIKRYEIKYIKCKII